MLGMNKALLSVVSVWAVAASANAGIVSFGGSVALANPPANIQIDNWESDTAARLWAERTVTLSSSLNVDALNTGSFFNGTENSPGILAAGTAVQSYMLRSDPVGSNASKYQGFITFDRPIMALIFLRPNLNATDDLLGKSGVTYNKNTDRGLELPSGNPAEGVILSDDRMRIDFSFATGTYTDDVRIITAASIPAPATAALLGLGLVACTRRRGRVDRADAIS